MVLKKMLLKAHYYVEALLGYKHDAIKMLYRIILIET